MRTFYFLFIILVVLPSCSTSNESMDTEMEEMQMEEDMEDETTYAHTGSFVSVAHPTSGKAKVNDDKTKLIFEDFNTDDGPLLEVYLATDSDASNFISLGVLKGTFGDFEYDLPENVDYTTHNHVIIWCVTFSVNFGYAVLQ